MSNHMNNPHEGFSPRDQQSREEVTPTEPEYIILEGDEPKQQRQTGPDLSSLASLKLPFAVRILALFGLGAVLVYAWLSFICLLIYTIFSAITLFKVPQFTQQVKSSWAALKQGIAYTLGLLITLFSPALGFGFLLLHAALHRDSGEGYVSQFVNSNINRYTKK